MAKPDSNKAEQTQNRNWYKDRYETVVTQRNFLGTIALVSLTLALVAGMVILMLVPAKTVMPFLIQVDEKSGVTQYIDPKTSASITADEALRKYFVIKFVRARESYDSTDLDVNIDTVRLLSVPVIYREYWNEVVNSSNKDSLYVRLAANQIRQVRIKAVQFLDANRALVRLSITDKNKVTNRETEPEHFVALVSFEFQNLDLTLDEMLVNPLGFTVKEYKLDEDSFM